MHLFLTVLGLCFCMGFHQLWRGGGYCLVARHGLLITVASLAAEHGLQSVWASVAVAHGLNSCSSWVLERRPNSHGAQAALLHGMWDLPGPGIEPVSPALAGGFFTTETPGSPILNDFNMKGPPDIIQYVCVCEPERSNYLLRQLNQQQNYISLKSDNLESNLFSAHHAS